MAESISPEEIQAIRESLQMTQTELGNALGANLRTVQHWLNGDRRPRGPAVRLLRQLQEKAKQRDRARGIKA